MARFEVLMDEVDKKVLEMRAQKKQAILSGDGAFDYDPLAVINQDEKYVYKGVNIKPARIERFKSFGYELVPQDDKAQWGVTTKKQDGSKVHGDVVLMRIPRELWIERMAKTKYRQQVREYSFMEERKDNIDRIARNEARIPAHTSIVEDTSHQGESTTMQRTRTRQVPAV